MKKFNKFAAAAPHISLIAGKNNVLTDEVSLVLNGYDGSPSRTMPDAVINIADAAKLPAVIKTLNRYKLPFVPRAAATNHDGGTVPLKGGAVLNFSALNKIILINTKEQYAIVECGVINQQLQDALAPLGFFYAPDPASMAFSSIGGNCALNAGGAKTLKYGSSAANMLAARIVTPEGDVLDLEKDAPGPGLLALLARSEGTLGIITRLRVKITQKPEQLKTILAYFATLEDTMNAVRDIIASGILPSALEAMDKTTLDATRTPYPAGMEAMLIIELDSKKQLLEQEVQKVTEICLKNKAADIETARDETQRAAIWSKRKAAAASMVKLAPGLLSLDCALPRASLPFVIKKIRDIFKKYGVRAGLVFHAGDGNVHPNIAYDATNLYEAGQAKKAVKEINEAALEAAGSISGEHGVGIEKRAAMALMFTEAELELFRKIKTALDPKLLANPDKIIPIASCAIKEKAPPAYLKNLQQIIKKNNHTGSSVVIAGFNTKLKTGKKNILPVNTLTKITDIDAVNYTVTVQAGAELKDIAAQLAKNNMYLPLQTVKGSIGGVFAAGICPRLADYVTGVDFILPDGIFISLGGKYVKNAAGYDLIRFLCGSRGAYGLITALTIRTFAAPQQKLEIKKFGTFEPDAYHVKLKKVFDPGNLFNPFVFVTAK
jgi:glycolate oxidase subunit GlcD